MISTWAIFWAGLFIYLTVNSLAENICNYLITRRNNMEKDYNEDN